MKKYLLIGHKDSHSPYALEAKLRIKNNNDNIDVVVVNVPSYQHITYGLKYIQERIEAGAIVVSAEVQNYVRKLNRLSGDIYAHLEAPPEVLEKVRQELGYFWLKPDNCIVLKDKWPKMRARKPLRK